MTSRLLDDDDGPTFVPLSPANSSAFHRSSTRPARGGSDLLDDAGGHLVAVAVDVFFAAFLDPPAMIFPWPVVVVDDDDDDEAPPPTSGRPPPAFFFSAALG